MRGFVLVVLLLGLLGCSSAPRPNAEMDSNVVVDPTEQGLLDEYRIGVGDSLIVSVWRNPELSAEVVVLPDGMIAVPLGGDVKAAGETTESLAASISGRLNKFIRDPNVTVSVMNAASAEYLQRVRITGAVNAPQSIVWRRGLTVLDVVLLAGGISEYANANRALLYRKTDERVKIYPIRLEDILAKGLLETNYTLLPSDIITVPEKGF